MACQWYPCEIASRIVLPPEGRDHYLPEQIVVPRCGSPLWFPVVVPRCGPGISSYPFSFFTAPLDEHACFQRCSQLFDFQYVFIGFSALFSMVLLAFSIILLICFHGFIGWFILVQCCLPFSQLLFPFAMVLLMCLMILLIGPMIVLLCTID